jgi:hypothetical protein
MSSQSWATAVELDRAGGKPFVRVIEKGVVHIRSFELQTEAAAFAQSEMERLGAARIVQR